MKIYAALKATERSVKLSDCVDTLSPDASKVFVHNWNKVALRRYIRVMRSIDWDVDTTDVRDLLNGLYPAE